MINSSLILSADGGGIRGIFSLDGMRRFCSRAGLKPDQLYNYAAVGAGTSIGAIVMAALMWGMTPDDVINLLMDQGKMVFTIRTSLDVATGSINASEPSNVPNTVQKIAILISGDQFYSSVDPVNSNYGSALLARIIGNIFGDKTMQAFKTSVIFTAFDQVNSNALLYSNVPYLDGYTGQDAYIKDVLRSSSAAPLYFPPVGNNVDGGIIANNPSRLALTMAKRLNPYVPKKLLVSLGTGLGQYGFEPETLLKLAIGPSDTIDALGTVIGASINGAAEVTAYDVGWESGSVNKFWQYRHQSKFPDGVDTLLDNTTPEFLDMLLTTSETYFNNSLDKVDEVISHLSI